MAKTKYHKAICEEMKKFAKDPKVMFLGQQVATENFYDTLTNIPMNRRTEMPVAEEMQMGLSIGLALEGYLPISIYQRMDFLPRAADQLVNHLNLIESMSRGIFKPKVIIRTTIGSNHPFNVGPQHNQDLTQIFMVALKFPVYKLTTPSGVHSAYEAARVSDKSVLIIECQDLYYE